jgi:hypothetical protein
VTEVQVRNVNTAFAVKFATEEEGKNSANLKQIEHLKSSIMLSLTRDGLVLGSSQTQSLLE